MTGKIEIDGKNLVFEIKGIDVILAIRRTITIPMDHVVSVTTEKVSWEIFQQLKMAGTNVPGIIKDGTYLTDDGLMFFEMHHPDQCITVTLNHETYKKIVFEVEDKEAIAKMINDAINKDHSEK
ncbi:MAG: hypothetical protein WA833_08550 [Nitrosotalea sp.]